MYSILTAVREGEGQGRGVRDWLGRMRGGGNEVGKEKKGKGNGPEDN